ncbi:TPA: hypothetical protein HA251_07965 [Candidatus Woesearchaeota archaeon]|nr:hypothetical protein [Candidatus Woesearchaeota archaeon]
MTHEDGPYDEFGPAFAEFWRTSAQAAAAYTRIGLEPHFYLEGLSLHRDDMISYAISLRNNTGYGEPWCEPIHIANDAEYGRIHRQDGFTLSDQDIMIAQTAAQALIVARGFKGTERIGAKYLDDFCGKSIPFPPQRWVTEDVSGQE